MKPNIQNKKTKLNYCEKTVTYKAQEVTILLSKDNILEALDLPHRGYDFEMDWNHNRKKDLYISSLEKTDTTYPMSKYFYAIEYYDLLHSLRRYIEKNYNLEFPNWKIANMDKYPKIYVQPEHIIKKSETNPQDVFFEYLTLYWITNPVEVDERDKT